LIGIEERIIRPGDLEDNSVRTRINDYYTQRRRLLAMEASQQAPKAPPKKSRKSIQEISIAVDKAPTIPGLNSVHAREAKLMSEEVYPLLYVFENSARDVIAAVLEEHLGEDWWEEASWSALRSKVKNRMEIEGKEAWHSKRGDHPLQYVDLGDLATLIAKPKNWPYFESLFPRETWFEAIVDDLSVSRNVIAHMNPISADDVAQVQAGYARWARQLDAIKDKLP
jgi:hypothetical protein